MRILVAVEDVAMRRRVETFIAEHLEVARELGRLTGTAVVLLAPANGTGEGADPPPTHPGLGERGSPYLERIAVEVGAMIRPVPVTAIEWIGAAGPYAALNAGTERHLVRESLSSLEERLDPRAFLRVHRSSIVRLDRVVSYRREPGGAGEVLLRGGARVRVSRSRRNALERWLGMRP